MMKENSYSLSNAEFSYVITESVKRILMNEWTDDDIADTEQIKAEFDRWVGNRIPCMETPSGSVIYFNYDENRNVFQAGTLTNAGLAEIECVPASLDVRSAIDELIENLRQYHNELFDDEATEDDIDECVSLKEALSPNETEEDKWNAAEEADEDFREFNHAVQKASGALNGKKCGSFVYGQKVKVKVSGDLIDAEISEYDINPMTYKPEYSVYYMKDGKQREMIGIPEDKIIANE